MKVKFNVVTWYSRLLSYFFIFGIFPVIVFWIGVRYNQTVEVLSYSYVAASAAYMDGAYDTKSFQGTGSHAARAAIAGTWIDNKDGGHELIIKPDNMFYEKNDGQVKGSGSWMIRDSLSGTEHANLPIGLYLQQNMLDMSGVESTSYYKVLMLNPTTLDISSLDDKATLSFTKKPSKK